MASGLAIILIMLAHPVQQWEHRYAATYSYQIQHWDDENEQESPLPQNQQQNCGNNCAGGEQANPTNKKGYWYDAFGPPTWPNWALAFIGIAAVWSAVLTLVVIAWQAIETRKSAQATKRSTILQEIQFQQWVTAKEWFAYYEMRESGLKQLFVTCKLFNPTSFTLTITRVDAGCRNSVYSYEERDSLIPGGFHIFGISTDLTEGEYAEQKLSIPIRITIRFRNVMSREQTQTIAGIVVHAKRGGGDTSFTPMAWMAKQYEEGQQKAK